MSCNKAKSELSFAKLKMADSVEVAAIEELREHFDLIALLGHYNSGELLKWLSGRYPFEAELVKSLDQSSDDFEEDLCSIFQVPFSLDEAVSSFREAAEQGNVTAQYKLGIYIMEGYGVPADEPEGVRWIRTAAENGNINAQIKMGVFCSDGIGVKHEDREEGIKWFKMAADSGSIEALNWLGGAYRGKDDEKAFHYFKAGAEKGDPYSVYDMALFYLNGKVVEKDEEKAIRMLRKAAECGVYEAAEVLENMGL